MNVTYYKNASKGLADHDWLASRHTFSFANYYDPKRIHFGLLRVLNDNIVKLTKKFSTPPHDNMEIVSIPLSGSLRHQDNMGNKHIISAGEIQIMSAGTGVTHSEHNNSSSEDVNSLQIWVFPKKKNITPGYDQKVFDVNKRKNKFQIVVSPGTSEDAVWINQDAWFSLADIDAEQQVVYEKKDGNNGVYFFVLEGDALIDQHAVHRRDGLEADRQYSVTAKMDTQLLSMEVPLTD